MWKNAPSPHPIVPFATVNDDVHISIHNINRQPAGNEQINDGIEQKLLRNEHIDDDSNLHPLGSEQINDNINQESIANEQIHGNETNQESQINNGSNIEERAISSESYLVDLWNQSGLFPI